MKSMQDILWQGHRMILQCLWTLQCQRCPIYAQLVVLCPKLQYVSTARRFWVTGHFDASATNDRKVTLNITNVKSIPPGPPSPNFNPFQSTVNRFRVTDHIEATAPNDPKTTLDTTRSACPIYVLLVSSSPKFLFISFFGQPFSSYRPFWDKCTEWPQNYLQQYKVISTPYVIHQYAQCKIPIPFAVWAAIFSARGQVHRIISQWPWTQWSQKCHIPVYVLLLPPPPPHTHTHTLPSFSPFRYPTL